MTTKIGFIQRVPQTRQQRIKIYMKLPKRKIAEMLAECNIFIEQIRPIINLGATVYNNAPTHEKAKINVKAKP